MTHWSEDSIFYHIYPLGFCGAPAQNPFTGSPIPRLEKIMAWTDHMRSMHVNALYLGPVFESTTHGYDTADYYHVDRRLGDRGTLRRVVDHLHQQGIRVILDGVFNHVGRDFWAFRDVLQRREASPYASWFHNLRFDGYSPQGDPFSYEGWNGHYSLVKLNLGNPAVKEHLLGAVEMWINELGIDGLRLDAADSFDLSFQSELAGFCRRLRPDFWLMGEVVHGNYCRWVNPATLDSVTNYECYKGLYSSLNDHNYFEIAYALNRQFGEGGIYLDLPLYAFVDNHDVNRVASLLANPAHLYPLYALLFTMPGVPSVYYGSEFGIQGRKDGGDAPLRPVLELDALYHSAPHPHLLRAVQALAGARRSSAALRRGSYRQVHVDGEQLAFLRQHEQETVLVVLNAAQDEKLLTLRLPGIQGGTWVDMLDPALQAPVRSGQVEIRVPSCWVRIMRLT